MSNYVQVRLQTSSSSTASINHDFRLSKVDYLRSNMFHNKWHNQYFGYNFKEVKSKAKQSYTKYNKLYSDNHLTKYGKRRKLTKGKQSDYLTGIITLSNYVNEKLANNDLSKDELEECFIEAVDRVKFELENEIGQELELFSSVIHYDEKTPHLHFALSNHTKKGEAVYHKIRTSRNNVLSKCQDAVGKAFKKIGFVRGEIKEKTKATHKSIRRMHEAEIIDLKAQKKALDEENKLLEKFKKEHIKLQEQIKELQEQKKQIKSSVKSLDLHAKVAKSELDNIDTKITYLREVIKYDKDLVSDIKELLEQYEESDLDGTVHELIRRINMTETINKQDYKLEVSEMLSRFNERTSKIKNTNIEKSDKIIKIDNTISSVSHKKAYTNKLPTN